MEVWLGPALGFDYRSASARIYGAGVNPISWVSYLDVAEMCALSVRRHSSSRKTIGFGGPEALSPLEVVRRFERIGGRGPHAKELCRADARIRARGRRGHGAGYRCLRHRTDRRGPIRKERAGREPVTHGESLNCEPFQRNPRPPAPVTRFPRLLCNRRVARWPRSNPTEAPRRTIPGSLNPENAGTDVTGCLKAAKCGSQGPVPTRRLLRKDHPQPSFALSLSRSVSS
jgi:hypothetical protein